MEGRDRPHALDLVHMAARLRQRLGKQSLAGPSPSNSSRFGFASLMCLRAISAQASRSADDIFEPGEVEAGEGRAVRLLHRDPDRGEHSPASSQASPPIGWPALASSKVGASLNSMIAASSGPWGRIRLAVADARGSCMLLDSQS